MSHQRKTRGEHGNLFHCSTGEFLSYRLTCDGTPDCSQENPTDEAGCECNMSSDYSITCKHLILDNGKKRCSDFYFQTKCGSCHLYDENIFFQKHNVRESLMEVSTKNQLSCQEGQKKTFNVSQICSYRLNSLHKLIPCEHGEHLQNCKQFECNLLFKCSQFYCVPWKYLCDGKWDCPGGFDESEEHSCGDSRKCKNLYRCEHHKVCIHLSDVCNGRHDCPSGDDEKSCSLHAAKCPTKCKCLTFVVRCVHMSLGENIFSEPFPFFVVQINLSNISRGFYFNAYPQGIVFFVTKTNLWQICPVVGRMPSLVLLDASSNLVITVENYCFKGADNVREIKLNRNRISKVGANAFSNLLQLIVLDLSNNLLVEFLSSSVSPSAMLFLLSLEGKIFTIGAPTSFSQLKFMVLKTQDFRLCCLASDLTLCTARKCLV